MRDVSVRRMLERALSLLVLALLAAMLLVLAALLLGTIQVAGLLGPFCYYPACWHVGL